MMTRRLLEYPGLLNSLWLSITAAPNFLALLLNMTSVTTSTIAAANMTTITTTTTAAIVIGLKNDPVFSVVVGVVVGAMVVGAAVWEIVLVPKECENIIATCSKHPVLLDH